MGVSVSRASFSFLSRRYCMAELIRSQQERALDVIEVRKGMESWTAYYAAQRALRSEFGIRALPSLAP